jgi:hypothetical protein
MDNDDLFDIIEPSEEQKDNKSDSEGDFVQDDSFVNSLDFVNGFSEATDSEIDKLLDNDGLILVEKSNLNFCPRCGKTLSSTDKEYSSDGYCIHCDFASTLNINKLYS